MQLSCGAAGNVGKFSSNDRRGHEIKYETPVIAHTSSAREDVCISTFDTSHGKDYIDQGSAVPEDGGDIYASILEALLTEYEVWLGKTFGNEPRIHVFIKNTKKDNIGIGMFPNNQLGNQFLKEDCAGQLQITLSLKVSLFCSRKVVTAELADLELEGWYAIRILVFYHQSQLSTSTNDQGRMGQLLSLPPGQKSIPLPSLHNHHANFVAFVYLHCGQLYF